jgi:predicted nucleic acid-binding protein
MRCFFDTNVLVYVFDKRVPQKAAVAQRLLSECADRGDAVISIQVLQEFYVAVTRKLVPPLSPMEAEGVVREFGRLQLIEPDLNLVVEAIEVSHRYRLSFWDGLIIQSALRAGAEVLYTEDLQNGQAFEDLTIRNPFVS